MPNLWADAVLDAHQNVAYEVDSSVLALIPPQLA
jgi:hypothetical protein